MRKIIHKLMIFGYPRENEYNIITNVDNINFVTALVSDSIGGFSEIEEEMSYVQDFLFPGWELVTDIFCLSEAA